MARTLLVVDNLSDWAPYYPSEQLITFEDYLAGRADCIRSARAGYQFVPQLLLPVRWLLLLITGRSKRP